MKPDRDAKEKNSGSGTTKAQHIKKDEEFTTLRRFLDRVALFRVLPSDELPGIAAVMEKRGWTDQTILVKQRDEGKEFFVIMDGSAELRVKVPGAEKEKVIIKSKAGDYFGETSIITSQPQTATVAVSGKLTTASITAVQFEKTGIRDRVHFPKREIAAAFVDFEEDKIGDED